MVSGGPMTGQLLWLQLLPLSSLPALLKPSRHFAPQIHLIFFPTCKPLHVQGPLLRMRLPQIFPWLSLPHFSSQSNNRVSDSLLGHVCELFCPSIPWSSHLVSFWRAVSALHGISYPLEFSCLFTCSSKYLSFHYSPSSIIVGVSVLFIPIVIQSQSWSLP